MGRSERETGSVGLSATALLLQRGDAVGRFTVQNLSAGGALLTGAHDVCASAPLRVLLELPSGEPISVGAHVRRRARAGDLVALAVAFRHVTGSSEDRIQEALLSLLDASHRAAKPAVLAVERSAEARERLVREVEALGRRAIAVATPLDAVRTLEDPDEHVDVLIVREGPDEELLAFAAEHYPSIRTVLYVDDPKADPAITHPRVCRCNPSHLRDLLS